MASVGLFFGSNTGNTEHIAKMIQKELGKNLIDVKDIAKSSKEDIAEFEKLKVNFNNLVDDVELIVDDNGGRIRSVSYSAMSDTLVVRISIISQFSYNSINNELLNLNWVNGSNYSTPNKIGDDVQYTSTFTIEVNYNVE